MICPRCGSTLPCPCLTLLNPTALLLQQQQQQQQQQQEQQQQVLIEHEQLLLQRERQQLIQQRQQLLQQLQSPPPPPPQAPVLSPPPLPELSVRQQLAATMQQSSPLELAITPVSQHATEPMVSSTAEIEAVSAASSSNDHKNNNDNDNDDKDVTVAPVPHENDKKETVVADTTTASSKKRPRATKRQAITTTSPTRAKKPRVSKPTNTCNKEKATTTSTAEKETIPKDWPLKDIEEPHENDFIMGGRSAHPGNARFFQALQAKRPEYDQVTEHGGMARILRAVVDAWRNEQHPPGRFLAQEKKSKKSSRQGKQLWYDVGDVKAADKARRLIKANTADTDEKGSPLKKTPTKKQKTATTPRTNSKKRQTPVASDQKVKKKKENPKETTTKLCDTDCVLFGGNEWLLHPGNVAYRELVYPQVANYTGREFALQTMTTWSEEHSGRFVCKDTKTGAWKIVPNAKACEKTMAMFRDAKRKKPQATPEKTPKSHKTPGPRDTKRKKPKETPAKIPKAHKTPVLATPASSFTATTTPTNKPTSSSTRRQHERSNWKLDIRKEDRAEWISNVMQEKTLVQQVAKEIREAVLPKGRFREPGFLYTGDTVVLWDIYEYNRHAKWRDEAIRRSIRRKASADTMLPSARASRDGGRFRSWSNQSFHDYKDQGGKLTHVLTGSTP